MPNLDYFAMSKMEPKTGREHIEDAFEKYGIPVGPLDERLAVLGEKIGYAARTLRGYYYNELKITPRFLKWVTKLEPLRTQEPSKYPLPSRTGVRVNYPSASISMTPPKQTNKEIVEELRHLLDDYEAAKSAATRQFLADHILKLAAGLNVPASDVDSLPKRP